jgi:hypothetical protein
MGYLSAVPNQAAVLVIQQRVFVAQHSLLSPVLYSRVLSADASTVVCYHQYSYRYHYFTNSSVFFSTMQLRACCHNYVVILS